MNDIAIHAEGLAKRYRIGRLQKANSRTLRDTIVNLCAAPGRYAQRVLRGDSRADTTDDTVWAVNDATFDIKQGEIVGLIGRNGAGKSTLLKILSKITEPTRGFADIEGRVGSLLEVGTGFHNELSGRENIFLNGAILGMKKAEIQRKFDEIVDFCQIERFLDTPVKHYSSGMYVRLAFAIASQLEPEILLVDEVLAVGDARFQRKCLHKMEDVAHGGRTVIFVSHHMSAVTRICQRAILMDEGRVIQQGAAHDIVSAYLTGGAGTTASRTWPEARAPRGEVCLLRAVNVRLKSGEVTEAIDIGEPIGVEMEFDVLRGGHVIMPHFQLWDSEGVLLFRSNDLDPSWRNRRRPEGRYVSTGWIPAHFLAEGTMFVDVSIATAEPTITQFHERSIVGFQVIDNMKGEGARGDYAEHMPGAVRPVLEWTTSYTPIYEQVR